MSNDPIRATLTDLSEGQERIDAMLEQFRVEFMAGMDGLHLTPDAIQADTRKARDRYD